jgi:hypothetical protein
MKRVILSLIAMTGFFGGVVPARATVIDGPNLPYAGGGDSTWGVQFTANRNSFLTGFTFNHRESTFGNSIHGDFELIDVGHGSKIVGSYPIDAPQAVTISGLSEQLIAGHVYQLIVLPETSQAGANVGQDEIFAYIGGGGSEPAGYGAPDYADDDITVTNGVYSGNTTGFNGTHVWYAFSNITTSIVVPEPAGLASFVLGLSTLAIFQLVKRSRRNNEK